MSRRLGTGTPLALVALLIGGLVGGAAVAATPPPSSPAPPSPMPPPLQPASVTPPPPSAPPVTVPSGSGAPASVPSSAVEVPAPVVEAPEPPIDAVAADSDHDLVRGRWGMVVRPVASTLSVTRLRPASGCPTELTVPDGERTCPSVSVASLSARRWLDRTLALDVGLAFSMGGGRQSGQLLDTYFGFGPVIGTSILLANWKHVAVAASPEVSVLIFKGSGSSTTAYVADLSANVEAELHFGFIGAPALSVGIRSGLLFRLEHADEATLWSVGAAGTTTISSLFHDVALRYYF